MPGRLQGTGYGILTVQWTLGTANKTGRQQVDYFFRSAPGQFWFARANFGHVGSRRSTSVDVDRRRRRRSMSTDNFRPELVVGIHVDGRSEKVFISDRRTTSFFTREGSDPYENRMQKSCENDASHMLFLVQNLHKNYANIMQKSWE